MANEFDAEFENYIIFHRGIADIYTDNDNGHLHVIYQDGYDQDMGSPYGDFVGTATEAATEASTAAETAGSAKNVAEGYAVGSQDGMAVVEGTYFQNNAKYYSEQASEAATDAEEAKDAAESALNTLRTSIGEIEGIEYNDESDKYYVNLTDYIDKDVTEQMIKASVSSIAGVNYDTVNKTYYVDSAQISTLDATIDSNIDTAVKSIKGVDYEVGTGYFVNFSKEAIPSSEIDALFGL